MDFTFAHDSIFIYDIWVNFPFISDKGEWRELLSCLSWESDILTETYLLRSVLWNKIRKYLSQDAFACNVYTVGLKVNHTCNL